MAAPADLDVPHLDDLPGPVVFVADHNSHTDTPMPVRASDLAR
jgi:hypothetical protein